MVGNVGVSSRVGAVSAFKLVMAHIAVALKAVSETFLADQEGKQARISMDHIDLH